MANLLQIKFWEVLQKKYEKNVTKILKTLVKDKTPVQLQAWHFTSKTRSSHRRCSLKKGVLKKSQNSQENSCVGVSFFIKLQATGLQLY